MLYTITRYRLQKGDFLSRYLASFPSNSMYTIEKQQQQQKKSQHLQRTWDLRVGSIKRMFQIQGPMMVYYSSDSRNTACERSLDNTGLSPGKQNDPFLPVLPSKGVSSLLLHVSPVVKPAPFYPAKHGWLTASIILWASFTNQSHTFENSTHISVRIHCTWLMNSVNFYP